MFDSVMNTPLTTFDGQRLILFMLRSKKIENFQLFLPVELAEFESDQLKLRILNHDVFFIRAISFNGNLSLVSASPKCY